MVKWEASVGGTARQYFFHGDVFIGPDSVVASADVAPDTGVEAGVHAFERATGRELWKYPAGRGVAGAVVGSGTRVFAYTARGDLIALNLTTGKPEWIHPLKAPVWESPAVVGSRVFAASTDGSAYAFKADTGRVEWRQNLGSPVSTSVRASDSNVYVGTSDGTMHRLEPSTGAIRGSLKLDSVLTPASVPVITGNAVVVLLVDQKTDYRGLVSLDPTLGRINWRVTPPDRWTTTRPFLAANTIVLGTPSGDVTAYCAADGSAAWSHKLASAPIRAIGGTDMVLFAGTPQGTLYAIHPTQFCR